MQLVCNRHRHTLFVTQVKKKTRQPEAYVDLQLQYITNIGLQHKVAGYGA